MIGNIKALIFVLVMAYAVFHFARPTCLRFMSAEDFDRRRKVWFGVTFAVFLSPSFWIYVAIVTPLFVWAAKRDSNPLALYLVLVYASPAVAIPIPVVGINRLFELAPGHLLAFTILIPLALRHRKNGPTEPQGSKITDFCVFGYAALQFIMWLPHESLTSGLRGVFLLYLGVIAPYWAFSRCLRGRDKIAEAICCFVLAAAILAPIAVLERVKFWLVYVLVGAQWGSLNEFAFLLRNGVLRAQVTAGHALSLGYLMATAFGFWFYLQRHQPSKLVAIGVGLWMWLGLIAAYSRGPWIVAVFFMFTHLFLMPKGFSRVFRAALSLGFLGALVLATPLGDKVIDNLPFIGTVDSGNVEYRQKLIETSMALIKEKPWFGDLFVMRRMEHLRQGQGIIDIVNGYLLVALFYGLVGLGLMVGFLGSAMAKAYFASLRVRRTDEELSALGSNLVACMLASMLFVAVAQFEALMWLMTGMMVAYACTVRERLQPQPVPKGAQVAVGRRRGQPAQKSAGLARR